MPLRTKTKIIVVAAVYLPTLMFAGLGVRLAAPLVEEWQFPVIDPKTDRVLNVHMDGRDLCWSSAFYKQRSGKPVRVAWTMTLIDQDGVMPTLIIGVAPRRVNGPLAPEAQFVDLPQGERHSVSWCVTVPRTDFDVARVNADWEYRTHGSPVDDFRQPSLGQRLYSVLFDWSIHQGRAPVIYRQPS